ncbi:NUDIX domain-containing protein [Nocardia sputorum]|uniref:DNA mismatch repair protein MutT n=1 Tax=Nocardia sputorum TaxID=2984338 RepID=A0ABN6U4H9_9NOCA|nr:NUDIX domain-containing protein [Nocardia sputorum]BDU00163.1 DNA mismatch repair protein MutT [Nocardia sputorum]
MSSARLRHAVRAIVLDADDRILLCGHSVTESAATVVWAAPGGGIEPAEEPLAALRRELSEEIGLTVEAEPPHIWHQEVHAPGHAPGFDGVVNDFYLVRTTSFTPRGALTDQQLAAENITAFRWWRLPDISGYRGADLFAPRDLAALLQALITDGIPRRPVLLGL